PGLLKYFKPPFLGRLVIAPYYPLSDDVIRQIVRLKMKKIQERFEENHKISLTYSENLVLAIAARCTESDTGARDIDHLLTHSLLPELSGELLRRMAVGESCIAIHIYLDKDRGFGYRFYSSKTPDKIDEPDFGARLLFLRSLLMRKFSTPISLSKINRNRERKNQGDGSITF
ncbi:MAG: hypothetical protein HC887_08260, partial [Desulfobacteraceae bacterium]|nr:hypothetical protein [Desulfobacteraceae bacterium]